MPVRAKSLLLLLLAFMALAAGVGLYSRAIAAWLLPLHRQAIELLIPDSWQLVSLRISEEKQESFITVRVETTRPGIVSGQIVPAGLGLNGSTLLGHALQPPLLMFTLLLAWLFLAPGPKTGPILLSIPFLLMVETVDVPLVLTGSIYDILHANFAANSPTPIQTRCMHLLNGGGRQALPIAATIAAITLGAKAETLFTRFRSRRNR
jgi:hypothetical protein